MVQIVSRTLSGLFLVGALNRPRKRKRTNRENPRTIHEQSGKIQEKSGKSQKGQKRTKKDKKGRTSQDWETPPRSKPPRLAALDIWPQTWNKSSGSCQLLCLCSKLMFLCPFANGCCEASGHGWFRCLATRIVVGVKKIIHPLQQRLKPIIFETKGGTRVRTLRLW